MPTPDAAAQPSTWRAPPAEGVTVVCVECQEGVLGADSVLPSLAEDSSSMVDALERLTRVARTAGVPVVHATFCGRLGATELGSAPLWRAIAPATANWGDDHPATAVLSRLYEPTDLVLPRHHGLSPTWGTELLPVLRARGVRTIVFAGVSLNVAITLAVGEAVHQGFEVVVPRDAVGATPPEYGEQILRNTVGMLARVLTVDDLAGAWAVRGSSR